LSIAYERRQLYVKSYQKYGDPKTVKKMSNYKKELEIQLRKTLKTEDKKDIEIKIDQCEKFLNQARKGFEIKMKSFQVNTWKRIKAAYERIKKNAEEHKNLLLLLKERIHILKGQESLKTFKEVAPLREILSAKGYMLWTLKVSTSLKSEGHPNLMIP